MAHCAVQLMHSVTMKLLGTSNQVDEVGDGVIPDVGARLPRRNREGDVCTPLTRYSSLTLTLITLPPGGAKGRSIRKSSLPVLPNTTSRGQQQIKVICVSLLPPRICCHQGILAPILALTMIRIWRMVSMCHRLLGANLWKGVKR